jgi:hypothetical protein
VKIHLRSAEQLFTPDELTDVNAFLTDVRARLNLRHKHTLLMLEDHVSALHYFTEQGISLQEAMKRLDPAQLGDFYLVERSDWYPLDHAAKIYPLSMSQKRMMVFRVSCYLRQPVVPEILQMALTYTVKRFPYFATTIKSGFFWHYLDSAMRRFSVRPEVKLPCSVMRVSAGASPSFRVVHYQNRVSVEFFHILSDGAGASIFLRTLLREYLRLLGHHIPSAQGVFDASEPPEAKEWRDDFIIGDRGKGAHGFVDKRAVQLRGRLPFEQPNRILHYNLSVAELGAKAKGRGVTITALVMGYLMLACKEAAAPTWAKRKIQIQMPVNMRKYYPSATLRNFSMYCSIRLHPSEIQSLEGILPSISAQMLEGGSKERLDQTMHLSRRLVRLLRFVPLIVKRPIAYSIYGLFSDSVFTTTLSNLGLMRVPAEMEPFIEKFDCVLGAPITNRACCALCSYGDMAVLSVTKNTPLTLFEDALYRILREDGLEPIMEGSD